METTTEIDTSTSTEMETTTETNMETTPEECQVKLFCFLVMRSSGHDLEMVKLQLSNNAGIFHCDDQIVVSDKTMPLDAGKSFWSIGIDHHLLGNEAGAFENHDLFKKAWKQMAHDGRYKNVDWVIKTDPDTVFMADRLRSMLGSSHAATHATFYANY